MFGTIVSGVVALPQFKGRGRLIRLLTCLPYTWATSRYGVQLRKNRGDRTYRFSLSGSYGDFIPRVLRTTVAEPFFFVDIGANQGVFSLVAAKNPLCTGVFAFEPNPDVFALLVSNIRRNGVKVDAFCAAISAGDRAIGSIAMQAGHSGGATVEAPGQGVKPILMLNRAILNEIAETATGIGVCKIDVEGHELVVLEEYLQSRLLSRTNYFIVELSRITGGERHQSSVVDLFAAHGFHMIDQSGAGSHYDALFARR